MDKDSKLTAPSPGKNLIGSLRGLLTQQEGEADAQLGGLSAWVQSVSMEPPEHLVKGFIQQITAIRQQKQNVRAQLRQLEILLKGAEPHLCDLETQLNQSVLPLTTESRNIATALDSLLKAFSQAYHELAETLSSKWFRVLHARQQPLAALYTAQLIHRRALIAYRVYSSGSAQRWKQFRSLLLMNEEARHESRDEAVTNYINALDKVVAQSCLMALSDPSTLGENDIAQVRLYTERYAHLVKISTIVPTFEADTTGIFAFSDSARGPQRLKQEHINNTRYHFVDTRPLLAKLAEQIQGLQAGQLPSRLGLPGTANDPSYLALLIRCHEQWSEPRKRRHSRNGVRPRADLVSGFAAVFQFVAQNAMTRRRSDETTNAPVQAPTSEWAIIDQSEGGYGLRFLAGQAGVICVGEIVALRFKERASVAICITRRARSISSSEFEIGLELLAERALATTLPAHAGVAANKPAPVSPAILLPRINCGHKTPAIVVPSGRSRQPIEVMVRSNGSAVRLCSSKALEHLHSCELVAMQLAPT
ncbi:hypothetical protein [Uliginosibacterium gangwonense]|uniref:hypothetical protein n=1 Tax=Uliginosibacterium gangwonense TaxID=392736 RepID=UPI0003825622|nr:hypothetical protein [Uliginosibacterium gangwonense]